MHTFRHFLHTKGDKLSAAPSGVDQLCEQDQSQQPQVSSEEAKSTRMQAYQNLVKAVEFLQGDQELDAAYTSLLRTAVSLGHFCKRMYGESANLACQR
jgi:hypothetical protein